MKSMQSLGPASVADSAGRSFMIRRSNRFAFCRAMLCINAAYVVMRSPSVCPSVRQVREFFQNE